MIENNLAEPQLSLEYNKSQKAEELNTSAANNTLNVLSLFSGCGGMDVGFEGGFSIPTKLINKDVVDDFIEYEINRDFSKLKATRFKTVFANDILPDAKNAWINHFFNVAIIIVQINSGQKVL